MSQTAPRSTLPSPNARLLLELACVVVVVAGLKAAEPLLVPLVVSVFLAIVCAPPVVALRKRGLPNVLAITLVVLGVFAVLVGIGSFVGAHVDAFVAAIPRYQAALDAHLADALAWWSGKGIDATGAGIREALDVGAVLRLVEGAILQLASLVSNAVLVLIIVVVMLVEVTDLPHKLRAALGDPGADLGRFVRIADDVKRYLGLKTLLSLATGLVTWAFLHLLGIDFAGLWALAMVLLNFIPTVGFILAAIPPTALALVQHGPTRAGVVLGCFVAVNLLIGNVLEPHLMGRRLGLSTLVVFLSLVFWGWLWGVTGMLLSVPLTMVLKILLENSERWRGIAVLMGPALVSSEPAPSEDGSEPPRG